MTTKSDFYYPVTMHQDLATSNSLAPVVKTLPLLESVSDLVAILDLDVGDSPQGLYVFNGHWRFAMPMPAISASIIRGDSLSVYLNKTQDVALPVSSEVYKNGNLQPGDNITHGDAIYAVRTPPSGGGGGGAVDSVNGQTGTVTVNATNLPGLSLVGKTNLYSDLTGKPAALAPATDVLLGGVLVPTASNLVIDSSGNIDVKPGLITSINGKLTTVVTSGTGTSLVRSVAAGTATLKSIKAGASIAFTDDGLGTITIDSTATGTVTSVGGKTGAVVIQAGTGIVVDTSGANIVINASGIDEGTF